MQPDLSNLFILQLFYAWYEITKVFFYHFKQRKMGTFLTLSDSGSASRSFCVVKGRENAIIVNNNRNMKSTTTSKAN